MPSTVWSKSITEPVTIAPASLSRWQTIGAMSSSGRSSRPSGASASAAASQSSASPSPVWTTCSPSVAVQPMFSPLTRIRSARSWLPALRVSVASAPLEAA